MQGCDAFVLCLALYDVHLIKTMETICFHKNHFESILHNICMLVFSNKLHHVCVKRGDSEEKKNIKWLLGKAFVFSRTQEVRA